MIKFEDFANAIDSDHVRYLVICDDKPYADYLTVTEARSDKCSYRGKHIEGESVKIKDFDCNFYVSYERIILLVINGITYVNKREEKR